MRYLFLSVIILLCGMICLQCSAPSEPNGALSSAPIPVPLSLTPQQENIVTSTNDFGFDLFGRIAAVSDPDSNIFISPLSISYALGMLYNGADGATKAAIADVLRFPDITDEQINTAYHDLMTTYNDLDENVTTNLANSIWYRDWLPVEPTFIEVNRTYFDAAVKGLNFSAIWAADTINNWVDVNTYGKIQTVVDPPLPDEIVMYLINAIYFKAAWYLPFDTASTWPQPFVYGDGTSDDHDFMHTDTLFDYFEDDLLQAVDLPYGKGNFAMTILLPKEGNTGGDIINGLTASNWATIIDGLSQEEVAVDLPKFKYRFDIKLNDILSAMGMAIAFDPYGADLTRIVSRDNLAGENLFVSYVQHKSFVQVDEEGTQAAAVTVVGIGLTGIEPAKKFMIVNKPFVFAIREKVSGAILFLGEVKNPVWVD